MLTFKIFFFAQICLILIALHVALSLFEKQHPCNFSRLRHVYLRRKCHEYAQVFSLTAIWTHQQPFTEAARDILETFETVVVVRYYYEISLQFMLLPIHIGKKYGATFSNK